MKNTDKALPVHDSLQVTEANDLYRTEKWWKAVVTYQFESSSDNDETAVYLWHDDDGWTRKNKYVIKTLEAWQTDREIIDQYIRSDRPSDSTTAFPVSDYYTVGVGETVFQNDDWRKAIVNVTEKGTYETNEVMVYLWQNSDGEWRRRQKYTIKNISDWEEESEKIEEHVSFNGARGEIEESKDASEGVSTDLSTLEAELSAHLSDEFR